jgi:vacuolar-type H+-ATPase subunit E/Vma4
VRVNPLDADPAARHFPDAIVATDASISGGMEASGEGGRIAVNNTLEARLAIAWPDLLPELLAELAAETPGRGTAA